MSARVLIVLGATVAGATTAIALTASSIGSALDEHRGETLTFLAAALLLQMLAVKLASKGSVGVSAIALLAAAIALGAGPAMAIAVCTALAQWLRSRGLLHRALFDAANMALAAGAAAAVFDLATDADSSGTVRLLAAVVAGFAYTAVNHALLCVAMAASEGRSPVAIWYERFHWARYHYLPFGILALLAVNTYADLGAVALVTMVTPPALLALSLRRTLRSAPTT